MDRVLLSRASFSCLILLLIGGFFLTMASDSHADSFEELRANLPERMMDWVAEPGDQLFDRNTIFDYINGGGELYRAYNLQRCLSRRYTTPDGPAIVLDIFDMGTSKDAFGVFTHNTDGNVVHVGQGARSQPGWLRFWKSRTGCPFSTGMATFLEKPVFYFPIHGRGDPCFQKSRQRVGKAGGGSNQD